MIIYQLLPRLFSNDTDTCISNGSIQQNGCGKFNQLRASTFTELKKLGVTHVWYTGILEHATQTNYSEHGIYHEHPAMVKGKAGSPYAVKDYYDVDPDLASTPSKRFQEFRTLIERTHKSGLKVIIDFIPNHVAREYHSDSTPADTTPLGATDHTEWCFSPLNNFYYIQEPLACQFDMQGTALSPYSEYPARATGNDCFTAHPSINDWYETAKLNYGVDYFNNCNKQFAPIPDTWHKMKHILLFWASQGVDAFRCDMAEMVPVEFWEWVIPSVKDQFPYIQFIAEVYNPVLYRSYIHQGHFDFLYDKVGLYDTLRNVTCGNAPATSITPCWQSIEDIRPHMLNFLENHDEQRIASSFYAGSGMKGKAALIVSSCINIQPFMLYSGQELGEQGMDAEGFSGLDGRTTIFDYWSVPSIRKWRNKGKYTLTQLNAEQKDLLHFYRKVLTLRQTESALNQGLFFDLMYVNPFSSSFNNQKTYAFIRSYRNEHILIVVNFSDYEVKQNVVIPQHAFNFLQMKEGEYKATELITNKKYPLSVYPENPCGVTLPPFSGVMLKFTLPFPRQ